MELPGRRKNWRVTTTRFVLMVVIFQLVIKNCCAVNGIIWRKQQQKFVQLFSIPEFADFQKNVTEHQASNSIKDMRGIIVKASYYEDKNIVMFHDNDTKITGICGDIMHYLSDYLNFTLIPVRSTTRSFGEKLKNGSYSGLIGMLERNEAQIIMRSAFRSNSNNKIVDYTLPLWRIKFHIYVQPEWLFDNKWVFTLFSWQMWFYVALLFIVLSCFGYFLQKISTDKFKHAKKRSVNFSLGDHFFYSFVIMTAKGDTPVAFYNKFKILSFSKSVFAWFILLAFSSNLIFRMTNRQFILPFTDIESLINNTKYTLLAFRGSFMYSYMHNTYKAWVGDHPFARVRFIENSENMHATICSDTKKYAIFESEDRFRAVHGNSCPLRAVGNFNDTWITFALQKNYPYKKSINYVLIKMKEVGLTNSLINYWFNVRLENPQQAVFKTIDMNQVYLIFLILSYGILLSLLILVLENITYYYQIKIKNTRQHKRRK
ncbi:hypothetical protein PUN28_008848 [Cardiocondyla obscurior]|uniref:Uncharacterized protein n=3 Tax=Cardiocondyla obscurior TaxID=286306 RepID=A0AAW2FQM6_9HYME